jgi:diguanylate cyclase (GGDEF)-like protein
MKPGLLTGYAAVMAVAIGAFFFSPDDSWVQVYWQVAVGWAAAAAVVVGTGRYRPRAPLAWYLFAAGVFLNAAGILVEALAVKVFDATGYPTLADAFWLGLYPGLAGGMVLLIRSRTSSKDWSTMVDATTITTGLGLLSWVFVIHPQAADPTLSLLGRAAVASYPVGDLVVLGMVVRMLLGGGTLAPTLRLMVASLFAFLGGDVAWAVLYHFGVAPDPAWLHLLQMTFLVAYALVGAAALHPSVRRVADRVPAREARLSPVLLAGLALASLIAPALLIVQASQHTLTDAVAIGISSAALFLLVVTRMAGLLRQVELQSKRLRDLARVDELTGLPNRRTWSTELPLAVDRARRDATSLSVALLDLDHFKQFNDVYGHPAGDQLLRGAAAAWRSRLRAVDLLARYGGEEFIVLFPAADAAEASQVLERLRGVTPAGQTFSAGVATWNRQETGDELIVRADKALYHAKEAGRNRTVVHDGDAQPTPLVPAPQTSPTAT